MVTSSFFSFASYYKPASSSIQIAPATEILVFGQPPYIQKVSFYINEQSREKKRLQSTNTSAIPKILPNNFVFLIA